MPHNDHTPNLKETQTAFANAIRHNDVSLMGEGISPQRLGVYSRLVRNNTLGFIDRCYVETPAHLSPADWAAIKEKFVREGKAHSPFFQDIAGEFLAFCQAHQAVSAELLALMDFEHAQLLAEVSMANVPAEFEWDSDSVMQLSGAAELRQYAVNFLRSDFKQLEAEETQVIVWRDSDFGIYYQTLDELDFFLLSSLDEESHSLNGLLRALSELTEQNPAFEPLLRERWQKWVNVDVLYPI